ncbi:hypothetical protein COLO4_20331 [Corchorus olitorius]|uniref:Helitron helicase-like domain-containing protein n=1 Tax=Corchorus olitorius TaxID=93759 RepID=A0A1R3J0C2_9ROSI|nr:hypothetical protein COLO4_20331 [Corchorus olitorius]
MAGFSGRSDSHHSVAESEILPCHLLLSSVPIVDRIGAHSSVHSGFAHPEKIRDCSSVSLDCHYAGPDSFVHDSQPHPSAFAAQSADLPNSSGIAIVGCHDGDDQFWEAALAQYQQILTHHENLIDKVSTGIDDQFWEAALAQYQQILTHHENLIDKFTSLGEKIDDTRNSTAGPFVFSVNGLTYHKIGSMLPLEGETPKFAQLYVYDTEHEVQNRTNAVCRNPDSNAINHEIVGGLSRMLDETNEIARVFRAARDRMAHPDNSKMKIRFIEARGTDDRTYAPPMGSEIAALIVGQDDEVTEDRDVIVEKKSGILKRISTLHPLYMSFQYPLLFPHGEDGFHLGIRYSNSRTKHAPKRGTVTMREYYAYQLQQRNVESNTLLRGGRLLHQYMVDAFSSVDRGRLHHVKTRQKLMRSDRYVNVRDAIYHGDTDGSDIGKRIVLPASYTGGPRYMFQNYQDAMAICRAYGYPTLFITFTCNPKWKEIDDALQLVPGQRAEDRPDLVCRVFRLKVRDLMHDLLEGAFFGRAIAG